ncbi:MAG TPA: PadR family transcriptional regulator [Anaerolineales bacterium]|nr:PadR family transcriptional regulator [Anaerolineales bacterium]
MEPSDFGRFSDPALLILASLAGGEKHGYAMMEDIQAMTGVHLGPGTLYGALSRLEQSGMIQALPAEDRRRPYQLTTQGKAFLSQYLSSLNNFVSIGLMRLGA